MSVFLLVAGLTGTLLVFYSELDRALNPELMNAAAPAPGARALGPFEIAERVRALLPPGAVHPGVRFDRAPDATAVSGFRTPEGTWQELYLDPYTGRLLGTREWGNILEGTKNLMPFVYRLHYSLALGEIGTLLFGVVALLWTIDCFVGAYLTFPAPAQRSGTRARVAWLSRWLPAWLVRTNKVFSFVFTWHRASGLWVWGLLLVFAWSAVGFNLSAVYAPVMKAVTGMQERVHDRLPELPPPYPQASLELGEAHALGRRYMAQQAEKHGFRVERELWLTHYAEHGVFSYAVVSTLDISKKYPRTEVYFDARDGRFVGLEAATGVNAGNTISNWLIALHLAAVGGIWYRLLVLAFGLGVAALSVSGVWIWWRKRTQRAARVRAPAAPKHTRNSSPLEDARV
jgi:uncharacterized iron-regulated membrane protein